MAEAAGPAGAAGGERAGGDDGLAAANRAFYDAFERLDLAAMERIWEHADHCLCVHPGWPVLHGWTAIRESWSRIFPSTPAIQFIVTDVRPATDGDVGWVGCVENVVQTAGGPTSYSSVQATNVFRRTAAGWKMVIHHASPILTRPG